MEKSVNSGMTVRTFISIAMGAGASLLMILLLSFAVSATVYLLPVNDGCLHICAPIIIAVSAFGGGYLSARYHGSRGLILGLICALIVWLILLIGGGGDILLKLACLTLPAMAGGFGGSGR